MPVQVLIPTPLRKLTGDKDAVSAEGATISEIFNDLDKNFPGIKERLLTPDGKVHRFVNVYIGEEDIRYMDNLNSPVKAGETVSIVPAIAGG